ncbi:MAG: GIY-YIG nuclease family protein [Chitinophagaceae bacterium]|nr:GIY-YIG nuclease family protein [Chitinophagaceae bacterium]
MYNLYILYSVQYDRYYIGHSEVLASRLSRHNRGAVPSTKKYIPWSLVYFEEYESRAEASKRESEIKKKKSRKYIEYLVNGGGTGSHVPI